MSDRNFANYRHQHESNAEWNIRRKFFEKHSQKFPEDRLICLSMCHLNVEVYGCTYPPKVMRRLKELRDGVFWFKTNKTIHIHMLWKEENSILHYHIFQVCLKWMKKTRRWSTYFHVEPLTNELKLFLNESNLKMFVFFLWLFLMEFSHTHICNKNENLIWNKPWENCTMYI